MNSYNLFFEIVASLLFGACVVHARTQDSAALWRLLFGGLFGLTLEWATIERLHAYTYGQFVLMIGPVPICIALAWSAIIYSAMLFAAATTLPVWGQAILCGFFGLSIDLSMDAIAIRLGLWDWGEGFSYQFFGVPYANFWAWFWVVSSFVMGYRLGQRIRVSKRWSEMLASLVALVVGVITVLCTNVLIRLVERPNRLAVISVFFCCLLILLFFQRPQLKAPIPRLTLWVPLAMHLTFISAGLVAGIFAGVWPILWISVGVACLSTGLHWWAYQHSRTLALSN